MRPISLLVVAVAASAPRPLKPDLTARLRGQPSSARYSCNRRRNYTSFVFKEWMQFDPTSRKLAVFRDVLSNNDMTIR
jgi:hypothetical protein